MRRVGPNVVVRTEKLSDRLEVAKTGSMQGEVAQARDASAWSSNRRKGRVRGCCEVFRSELDFKTASTRADITGREIFDALVNHGRKTPPLPKRTDAAKNVTAASLRVAGSGERGTLCTKVVRECPEVEFVFDGNDTDHELGTEVGDERLQYDRSSSTERLSGLETI